MGCFSTWSGLLETAGNRTPSQLQPDHQHVLYRTDTQVLQYSLRKGKVKKLKQENNSISNHKLQKG